MMRESRIIAAYVAAVFLACLTGALLAVSGF